MKGRERKKKDEEGTGKEEAMAMAAAAAAVSCSAAVQACSTKRISTRAPRASASGGGVVRVRCAREEDGSREARCVSRREVFSLATLSVILFSAEKAHAKDVPLFGIRKQLEKAEKAVESEVKELAKQGGKELEAVSASFGSSVSGVSPVLQAGGVVGAELVAVLVASTVVNGLVSVPSK